MSSKLTQYKIRCVGNDTFYSTNVVRGKILKIRIDYDSDASANTDVTVKDEYGTTITAKSNSNTDLTTYPRTYAQDTAQTDLVYIAAGQKIPTEFIVFGKLAVTVADNTAGKGLTVYVVVEEY